MSSEWANRFKQIPLAVDYVDESFVHDVKALLERYFEERLETNYFSFLTEGVGTETSYGVLPTLETVWSSSEQSGLWPTTSTSLLIAPPTGAHEEDQPC